MKVEARLRTRHPDWTEDVVIGTAESICSTLLDMAMDDAIDSLDDTDVEDATLEECVLGVKKSLRKQNPGMSEDKIKSRAFAICNARLKGK